MCVERSGEVILGRSLRFHTASQPIRSKEFLSSCCRLKKPVLGFPPLPCTICAHENLCQQIPHLKIIFCRLFLPFLTSTIFCLSLGWLGQGKWTESHSPSIWSMKVGIEYNERYDSWPSIPAAVSFLTPWRYWNLQIIEFTGVTTL